MYEALRLFNKNIEEAKNLTALYEYLETSINSPLAFDDLLRAQIVYSVSAFDKLIHDIIRIGMIEIFTGKRQPTPQYLQESISIEIYNELISPAMLPPKEYIFEQAVFNKLKTISYQEPEKVARGLSYIWDEKYKWQKIASKMEMDDRTAQTTLKLIVARRNSIVHEADIDISTNQKYSINKDDCQSITDFLSRCGQEIVGLVASR
ncbi:HEPN domain-containing protein [Crocosphaera sp.]|uniref:HEPN domain-containing protein n=1 Tax=Crocosphaera sp. TaxID=2729996 RepID=UPI003F233B5A|nr:HEPN domain-containing protein [Crocosphaera sp.]